jgi:predicted RNA-binding protein (TIGR00451 family)
VVRDVTHGKALAIGRALKSTPEIEAARKGKVVENLHYVGDRLWGAA